MNPFDLPGPLFLALYIGAFIVALVLQARLRALCRGNAALGRLPRLTPYEAAYLVQGRERAVETALAKLAHDGTIAPAPEAGSFAIQAPLPEGSDPVLQDVYRELQQGRTRLQALSASTPASLQRIEARLQREGLLMADGTPEAACWRRSGTWPLWAVFALGAVKLGVGLSRGRPVGLLVVLLIVTLLVAWFSRGLPRLSARGELVVPELLKRNAALRTTALRRGADLAEADMLLAVALFGSTVLASGALAWVHQAMARPVSSGSSDGGSSDGGGSSCSSGGGSCSGGCGGGCGGCGS